MKTRACEFFRELQDTICQALEDVDGKAEFREDLWVGGRSRVIERGRVIEKGGVNLADITGELTERLAQRLEVPPQPFVATGISLVIHPLSPMIPTVHMNFRYLELKNRAWFGGGADLTPHYLFDKDTEHFHGTWRQACDRHDPGYYSRFKKWCDDYFYNKHRGEARGVGGIFFDYLDRDLEKVFAFVRDLGGVFLEAYLPIVERRRELPWGDRQRNWQQIRRGRYVEFNLVHDRGTLFGLETGGRTESILMSLPPTVRWVYDHRPEPGSPEEELLDKLRTP